MTCTHTADTQAGVRKAQTNTRRTRTEKYVEMTKADARQEVRAGDETQKTARLPSDEAELPSPVFPEGQ